MAEMVRFLKPMDLRATVRGAAIMAALFDKHRDCRFRHHEPMNADVGQWSEPGGHEAWFLFAPQGNIILGLDHESPMNPQAFAPEAKEHHPWAGIYDELPQELLDLVETNPFGEGFNPDLVTFCLWNTGKGFEWKKGSIQYPKREFGDPDGSDFVLTRFRDLFDSFEDEMEEQYGRAFDPDILFKVFGDEPLTTEELRKLKPDFSSAKAREPLRQIGVTI